MGSDELTGSREQGAEGRKEVKLLAWTGITRRLGRLGPDELATVKSHQ